MRPGHDFRVVAMPARTTTRASKRAAVARPTLSAAHLQIAGWWAGSRLFVVACAAAAQVVRWPDRTFHKSLEHHPLTVLGTWDSLWYEIAAAHGYLLIPGQFSDPAFFPLLPIVEHAFSVLGVPTIVTGVVVANLALLVGLIALYEVGRLLLPEADARRAAVYLAVFPYGFAFSMAYPESLALAAVALCALFALRRRWLAAGACVAAATLARPQGVFLALPLAAAAWQWWEVMPERERTRAVTAVLAGPAALISFSLYLWHVLGNPLAWSQAELAWGRSFSLLGPWRAFHQLAVAPSHHESWLFRDAAFCLIYLVLLTAARRAGISWPWILCGAAMVLLPLTSGTFTSDGRFGLLALPAFWGLAVVGRRVWADRLILALSPALLALAVFTIRIHYP